MFNWILSGGIVACIFGLQPEYLHSFKGDPSGSLAVSCDLLVDAGPDMSICAPGGNLMLMGSVTGNALFTEWTPSAGLNNPYILNPTATITGPITYTLTGWGIDPDSPDLVVNGNFESGNTGFSSAYTYVVDQPGIPNEMASEGTYSILSNPAFVHPNWDDCTDHTPGSGVNMMIVNGAASLQDVWCQTVTVTPNTWFNVAAWVASVHHSSPAILRFSINGNEIGSVVNAPSNTCQWVPFNATWNSGSSTTATICILNLNTALGGNDFALDDISMVPLCPVSDEVTISLINENPPVPDFDGPQNVCVGDIATYTVDFPADPQILNYTWVSPSGGVIVSGQGTTQATIEWEDALSTTLCIQTQTECNQYENCFEVEVGTAPIAPAISGPEGLCPGESTILYIQEQDVEDEYHWIIPSHVIVISGEGTNEIEIEWAQTGEVEICVEVTNECGTSDDCTYLTLHPSYHTFFDTILCEGSTIVINGTIYGNGVWSGIEHFTDNHGCDSLVEVEISESNVLHFTSALSICHGDSAFLGGAFQFETGTYTDSYTTITGCDSIVTTELTVFVPDTIEIYGTTCDPTEAGTDVETFPGVLCDSTVIRHIEFVEADTTLLFSTSCDLSSTGIFTELFSNVYGCDSTVVTHVDFLQSDTTLLSSIVCNILDTGTTTILLTNMQGCDSLVLTKHIFGGSDPSFLILQSCEPADTGQVVQHLININGCDSLIITQTELLPVDDCVLEILFDVYPPQCYNDPAVINFEVLAGKGPFFVQWSHADSTGTFEFDLPGYTFTTELEGEIVFVVNSSSGIQLTDTLVVQSVPRLTIQTGSSDHSGFGIACSGDSTGTAFVTILESGTPQLSYQWSNGDTTATIVNLAAGSYTVSVTDDNGCVALDTVLITSPAPMMFEVETLDLSCYGQEDGSIMIKNPQGGLSPWEISINGSPFQTQWFFGNLSPGDYILTARDMNGCLAEEAVTIYEPDHWEIDLGPDTTLQTNAPYLLTLEVHGNPYGDLEIAWSDHACAGCYERLVDVLGIKTYIVTATDENGCTKTDTVTLTFFVNKNLYIPNVFSPGSGDNNELFTVYASDYLEEVEELSIFDRWGALVFQQLQFPANAPEYGWDGTTHGKPLAPGVFVYKAVVRYEDGERRVLHGNVTVVR